jgi:hypothetical protein
MAGGLRKVATLVGSVVVAYVTVVAVAFAMQRTLIYYPPSEPPLAVVPDDKVCLRTAEGLDLLAGYALPGDTGIAVRALPRGTSLKRKVRRHAWPSASNTFWRIPRLGPISLDRGLQR